MRYSLSEKQTNELCRYYDVAVSWEDAETDVDEILSFLALQHRIDLTDMIASDGLKERFGDRLEPEVGKCLANQLADQIIETEKLDAALEPKVEGIDTFSMGRDWNFTVGIPLKPSLELSSYDSVKLQVPDFQITDDTVNDYIEKEIESKAKLVPDDEAMVVFEDSDVLVTVATNKSGMTVGPLTATKANYRLGSGILPTIFDEKLLAMKPGDVEDFEFNLTSKNFIGLDVTEHMSTHLELHSILKRESVELSDRWVKDNIPGAHDVDSYRRLVRRGLQDQGEDRRRQLTEQSAVNELAKRLPEVQLPAEYYEYSRAGLLQNVSAACNKAGISIDEFCASQGLSKDRFMMQMLIRGRQVLREGLALDALARHESYVPDEKDISEALVRIDAQRPDEAKKMLEMNGRTYQLREMATRIKMRKKLLSEADVEYVL